MTFCLEIVSIILLFCLSNEFAHVTSCLGAKQRHAGHIDEVVRTYLHGNKTHFYLPPI